MSTQILNIILYCITIVSWVTQICISMYVLLLMRIHRLIIREHRIDYLLYANTYFAACFIGIFSIDECAYSIYGQIYPEISFNGWWCKIKGHLLYTSACTFFYTFTVQAIYRFFCILYGTQGRHHSVRLYQILSIGIWLLSFFELLPSLLVGDIEYLPNDYHCQFAPTSIRGSFTVYSVGFVLPFSVTIICYAWSMYSIRKQNAALVTINQQANIRRDIAILKRLAIFLSVVALSAAPHIFLPIIYTIIGYLPLWIISLEILFTSIAFGGVSITLLLFSPHLKKLRIALHAVQPVRNIQTIGLQRQ